MLLTADVVNGWKVCRYSCISWQREAIFYVMFVQCLSSCWMCEPCDHVLQSQRYYTVLELFLFFPPSWLKSVLSLLLSCLYPGNPSRHQFGLQVSICFLFFFSSSFLHISPPCYSPPLLFMLFSCSPTLLSCPSPLVKSEVDCLQGCLKSCPKQVCKALAVAVISVCYASLSWDHITLCPHLI